MRLLKPDTVIPAVAGLALLVGLLHIGAAIYIPAKAYVAQILLDRAWERTVAGDTNTKPWPWADMRPIARIDVPRLKETAIVLEGANGQAMAFGSGHMTNTPAIGTNGTSVVAAHRDTHFAFLKDLKIGDRVIVTGRDLKRHTYKVSDMSIVHAAQSGIDPMFGGATGSSLALVTCYPFDAVQRGPLRFVVMTDLIEVEDA